MRYVFKATNLVKQDLDVPQLHRKRYNSTTRTFIASRLPAINNVEILYFSSLLSLGLPVQIITVTSVGKPDRRSHHSDWTLVYPQQQVEKYYSNFQVKSAEEKFLCPRLYLNRPQS
ncbi:MAG: hypothetical protein PUP91_06325 [Rhizonema sp. PD37]|nr:hypothetical protein [Rhizonema sp. PD37]